MIVMRQPSDIENTQLLFERSINSRAPSTGIIQTVIAPVILTFEDRKLRLKQELLDSERAQKRIFKADESIDSDEENR